MQNIKWKFGKPANPQKTWSQNHIIGIGLQNFTSQVHLEYIGRAIKVYTAQDTCQQNYVDNHLDN